MNKHRIVEIISAQHMCHEQCFHGELYCACQIAADQIMAALEKENHVRTRPAPDFDDIKDHPFHDV